MNPVLESRLYRVLQVAANFVLLDILWLLACLPVVTIFPATAAMTGVIRLWVESGDERVLAPFWEQLRENFRQAFVIGLLWTVIAAVLVTDFLFVLRGSMNPLTVAVYLVTGLVAIIYVITTVFVFPVMVTYRVSWLAVLRNSLLFGLGQLGTSVAAVAVIGVLALVTAVMPYALLASGSVGAYVVYRLCRRSFHRVEEMRASQAR
jgi:uncharacterized membrane protein YesL